MSTLQSVVADTNSSIARLTTLLETSAREQEISEQDHASQSEPTTGSVSLSDPDRAEIMHLLERLRKTKIDLDKQLSTAQREQMGQLQAQRHTHPPTPQRSGTRKSVYWPSPYPDRWFYWHIGASINDVCSRVGARSNATSVKPERLAEMKSEGGGEQESTSAEADRKRWKARCAA